MDTRRNDDNRDSTSRKSARDSDRLRRVGLELGAQVAAFDATDFERLRRFFDELPRPIDHVLITGPGPYYAPLAEFDLEKARRDVDAHLLLPLQVARYAASNLALEQAMAGKQVQTPTTRPYGCSVKYPGSAH